MAKKMAYYAPKSQAPRVGGNAAVITIVATVAAMVFYGWMIVASMLTLYLGLFFAIIVVAIVSLLVWLTKLSAYRQLEVDLQHRAGYEKESRIWIQEVVIPKIEKHTSILLTFDEALELAYTGMISKKLARPYTMKTHYITFTTDSMKDPIVAIFRAVDNHLPDFKRSEAVAAVPLPHKLRKIKRKIKPAATE